MTSNIEATIAKIKLGRIVPIIRGDFSLDKLLEIGDALLASPAPAMEVTLNTTNALEAIARLRERAEDNMLVGAGTVRTLAQADEALAAGAQFLVAPGFDAAVVARAQARDILHLPGVLTPTEVETAAAAGCRLLKLFPAGVMGPAYLKALRAPLDDVDFVPTGGISLSNMAEYVQAGAVAVGIGGSLFGPKATMAEIISTIREMQAIWKESN
jgi:Entner-Doudoroff aldolase